MFYFHYTSDLVLLKPLLESPVLQREGVTKAIEGEAPTMEQWRKARTASYGVVDLKKSADTNVEYEIVHGVQIKHYH